jgi:hypothetical protein
MDVLDEGVDRGRRDVRNGEGMLVSPTGRVKVVH